MIRSMMFEGLIGLALAACSAVSQPVTPTAEFTRTAHATDDSSAAATSTQAPQSTATAPATPTDTCATPSATEASQEQTDLIAFVAIGDSLTRGNVHWSLMDHRNTIRGGWVARLQTKLAENFPGMYELINQGVDGDRVGGVLGRIRSGVVRFHPAIVFVAIGSNDVVSNTTEDTYGIVMGSIFSEIRCELPEATIYLVGHVAYVKKYAEMAYTFLNWESQEFLDKKAERFNEILKDLADSSEAIYIDIPSQWPVGVEERWDLLADGIHPNDAGYEKMTEIIYDAISGNLVQPSEE